MTRQSWFWSAVVVGMFLLVLLGGVLRPGRRASFSGKGKRVRVGLVLSVGGLGDRSFNDSAYAGLKEARRLFRSLEVRFSEPRENAAAQRDLESFARQGYDLIIGVGFLMARAVKEVARRYPSRKFAIVDAVVQEPNVASLVFQEHEGSYLVGVLAALATRSGTVAFLGGMEIPLIKKFEAGFRQGVVDTRPGTRVLVSYLGAEPKAFHDPDGGEKLAVTLFGRGADVIFHAAGSSGLGAIKAAREQNRRVSSVEKKRYIIGVDSNQDGVAPGAVLTSMIKRVDVAVFECIKNLLTGRFEARVYRYGLAEGGVGTTDCRYSRKRLPPRFQEVLAAKGRAIIQGRIRVPRHPSQVKAREATSKKVRP